VGSGSSSNLASAPTILAFFALCPIKGKACERALLIALPPA